MTDYIIVNADQLPYWVLSAWSSFTLLGFMIGCELDYRRCHENN